MLTYQDLVKVGDDEKARITFVDSVIANHKSSDQYKTAVIGNDYNKQQNTTIMQYKKMLYDLTGKEVEDTWSANYKLPSNFFNRFVTQENQYLLGNGVNWEKGNGDKMGEDFDEQLQRLGLYALVEGVSFGFWNYDHLDGFRLTEFAPLWDEEDGSLKAGVRFWQIDKSKPRRAVLYELDGYTNIMWVSGDYKPTDPAWKHLENQAWVMNKTPYKLTVRESAVDGAEIIDWENYPTFPIVPLWGNPNHMSEIVGVRPKIDAYDLIMSGFANDLDNAQIFWILHNTGGMDDVDLAQFLERIRKVGATMVDSDDGVAVETHTVDIPSDSREKLLDRLSRDLHRDFMALDTEFLASSNATATQIRAAYEPLNIKCDQYEYMVLDFLYAIMELAGIEDNPSFTRSTIINAKEDVETVVESASYLPQEYVVKKILTLLGDGDKYDEVIKQLDAESMEQIGSLEDENEAEVNA